MCDLFTLTEPVDNIISNVPYGIAEPCARHMIGLARRKVALILPMTFWESRRRDRFFRDYPPIRWFPCSDRPSMPPGTTSGERDCYGAIIQPPSSGGTMPYGWFSFERGFQGVTVRCGGSRSAPGCRYSTRRLGRRPDAVAELRHHACPGWLTTVHRDFLLLSGKRLALVTPRNPRSKMNQP